MPLFQVATEWRSGSTRIIWVPADTAGEALDSVRHVMAAWCPLTESAIEGMTACYLAPDQQEGENPCRTQ